MTKQKEILDYGMTLPDVYMDAPCHEIMILVYRLHGMLSLEGRL